MWQDLKLAGRALRSRPGFTLVVLATVALGVGANTGIFSLVNAVVLRPLPYRAPGRLYLLFPTDRQDGNRDRLARLAEVELLAKRLASFSGLATVTRPSQGVLTRGDGASEVVPASYASAALLDVLGVAPALGRGFLPEEDRVGGRRVALLSHAAWLNRFGGDPEAVGRTVTFNGLSTLVVGVLPSEVVFPDRNCELWLPLRQSTWAREYRLLVTVGRLGDGVGEAAARAELAAAARALEEAFPATNVGVTLRMAGLRDELTREVRPTLLLLLGAVGLVLLVACTNVANLMLARGISRGGELAIRSALGASRGRLVQQLLVEGLLLGVLGGALGVALGCAGAELAMSRSGAGWPVTVDLRVLGFSVVVSLLTGAFFSLIPAWRLLRAEPHHSLSGMGRVLSSHQRLSRTLVVGQMALALTLLMGAGLLLRTVQRLLANDPGFSTRNLLTLRVHPLAGESEERRLAAKEAVERELRALPGVVTVGQVSRLPLAGGQEVVQRLDIQGQGLSADRLPMIDVRYATTDYFQAMGIPLSSGRVVTEQERDSVMINEVAARRFWPGEDPVGKLLRTAGSVGTFTDWQRVIGVVGNVRHLGLDVPPRPELYAYALPGDLMTFVIRTSVPPAGLIPAVRTAVARIDRRLALTDVQTMADVVDQSMAPRRFGMLLLAAFAVLALLLATIGLYGVMSYAVAQRRQEIGLRLALGAGERDMALMLVREGMALVLLGAALGLGAALALSRLMSSLLYRTSVVDPLTLAAACATLVLAGLLASGLAARRAANVPPMVALRSG